MYNDRTVHFRLPSEFRLRKPAKEAPTQTGRPRKTWGRKKEGRGRVGGEGQMRGKEIKGRESGNAFHKIIAIARKQLRCFSYSNESSYYTRS